MTVSKLATVRIISPNTSGLRTASISKVIVHHMAGNLTVEQCGSIFASSSRLASSNYGVGSDGRIGCYLEEEYHPWTTSSYWADDRGVTIEVADYDTSEWSPSHSAYVATVALCADICDRYGIEPSYTGDTDGTFVEHRMFAATSCPGDWWHAKMPQFIQDVKNAMEGRLPMPIECILHPDESGMLFHVAGNSIEYIPHPDCITALQDVAEGCGQDMPYIDLGTKAAPWGFRFFQACGQEDLYNRVVLGNDTPQEPSQPVSGGDSAQTVKDILSSIGKALQGIA